MFCQLRRAGPPSGGYGSSRTKTTVPPARARAEIVPPTEVLGSTTSFCGGTCEMGTIEPTEQVAGVDDTSLHRVTCSCPSKGGWPNRQVPRYPPAGSFAAG